MAPPAPIMHGGDLSAAWRRFGGEMTDWIDLSTGINPVGYPVPAVPEHLWRRLPDDGDAEGHLTQAVKRYFGTAPYLALAGSQAAIRILPTLLAPGKVGIADLSYGEYAPAFVRAGHMLQRFAYDSPRDSGRADHINGETRFTLKADTSLPDDLRYLVVVNPNNPTTHAFTRDVLGGWQNTLRRRGGLLIVDEAFIDLTPEASMVESVHDGGLLVLRSVGKFFGLAGIRAGFAFGPPTLLDLLADRLGSWTVSGPARHALTFALSDTAWQQAARQRLSRDSRTLHDLLHRHGLTARHSGLFAWAPFEQAACLQVSLAKSHIWTRLFGACSSAGGLPSLRFGLPAGTDEFFRLEQALARYRAT